MKSVRRCSGLSGLLLVVFALCGGTATAQTCAAPPAGFIGWWPGDGDARDLIGGHPGSASGGVSYDPGIVGQAFRFDGINGSVNVANTSGFLDLGANLTIELWAKAEPGFAPPYWNQGLATTEWYGIENSGPYTAFYSLAAPISPSVLASGVWYHIAGTYDGHSMKQFVNGVLVANDPLEGSNPAMSPGAFLTFGSEIGRGVFAEGRWFKGLIDEVSIYNRALGSHEIQSIVAAGSAGKCRYAALIQPPINPDGSSVFNASRGVVPVKFTLNPNNVRTCELPPATISLYRLAGGPSGAVDPNVYTMPADNGSNFRINNCMYVYNLSAASMGEGTYAALIKINDEVVGSAKFSLQ
jgi:hypothetical protein